MNDLKVIRTFEHYVSRPEMADLIGVSVRTLDAWVAEGCPSHTWGLRLRRFLPSEVIAWADNRESRAA